MNNRNELCRPYAEEIVRKLSYTQTVEDDDLPFDDGYSEIKNVEDLDGFNWKDEEKTNEICINWLWPY